MYTHIVIDLDGTLLLPDKTIGSWTKEVLIQIQKELGLKIILASGRPVPFMAPIAEELQMDKYGGFLISNNGATVYDCENKEYVFENKLEADDLIAIVQQVKDFEVVPLVHHGEYLYVEEHHDGHLKLGDKDFNIIEGELNGGNFTLKRVPDLIEAIDFGAYKVLVAGDADYIFENQDLLRGDLKDKYTGLVTGPVALEFTKRGVDKAFSLAWLVEEEQINQEGIMAFGDGQNDMTLFQFAKHGVAMGNAVDELLEYADAVTKSNLEEGIAFYLTEFLDLSTKE